MKGYYKLRNEALETLRTKLPERLYYHDYQHTLDVLNTCNYYLRHHKTTKEQAQLLRLGAILHDIGFIRSDEDHEETGAEIAEELMRKHHYSQKDILKVRGLIMATKIPQNPQNILEKILCDADLDYLGREDFYEIGEKLYRELKFKGIVTTRLAWNELQINFLKAHRFHTRFARRNRSHNKIKRIRELQQLVAEQK